jgi:hypothetical protein
MIAAEVEQVINLIVGGEEALRLAGRFELLHLPLSSVGVNFRLGCSVPCAGDAQCGHDLAFGRTIAGQLVGDHDARRSHLLLQQLAQ